MLNIDEEPRTLRTVADFATVPPGQLPNCLRAFKQWLQVQAAAQPTPAPRDEFVWVPRGRPGAGEPLTPLTDIGRLGLRPGALQQFRRMNIFALEDFSAVSLAEMGRLVNVGSTTVARIREMLQSVGLDFRDAQEAPARPRPRAAAAANPPPAFGDDTALADLRLKPQTLRKLVLHGVRTVGELRELAPVQLAVLLSPRRRQEAFRLLRCRGMNLRSEPPELELWRHGLLHVDELRPPADDEDVFALQPWLGAALTGAAHAAGVASVGQLRELAAAEGLHHTVPGIGPYSWSRIRRFFGIGRHAPAVQ